MWSFVLSDVVPHRVLAAIVALLGCSIALAQSIPADRCAGAGGTAICRGPEVGEFWYSYCDSEQLCNGDFGNEAAAVEDLRVRVHNRYNLCSSHVEYPGFIELPASFPTGNSVGTSRFPVGCTNADPTCRTFTWDVSTEEKQVLTEPVRVVGIRKNASGVCSSNFDYQINQIARGRVTNCPIDFQRNTDGMNSRYCWRAPGALDTRKNLGNSCGPHTPNPVNILTGNKYLEYTLYRGSGSFPLDVTIRYNSLARPVTAAFGSGPYWHRLMHSWRMTYLRSVVEDNHLLYPGATAYRPDGRHLYFKRISSSTYVADGDINLRLEKLVSPSTGEFEGWNLLNEQDETEVYDTEGRFRTITNRQGLQHLLTYDTKGRLVSVRHTNGTQVNFTYAVGSWKWTGLVLPDGGTYLLTYHSTTGELVSFRGPDQLTRSFTYGNSSYPRAITQIIDEAQNIFATYTYGSGAKVATSQLAGGVGKYTFTYASNKTTVQDPLQTSRNYDTTRVLGVTKLAALNSPCPTCGGRDKEVTYDANGNVLTQKDFNNNETIHTFDLARNLETSRTEAHGTARARTVTTQWHPTYRVPTQIDEASRRTIYTHDANGNALTRTHSDVTTGESKTWTYTYDSVGRVLTADGPRTDVSDITTYMYYNCTTGFQCGQVHTITNALGHVTTYNTYNAHGQPLAITDPNGVLTTLTYDLRQRLTSRTVGTEQTTFEYWPTGLLKKATLPDGSYLAYTYDAAHRLTDIHDAEGNQIHYTLDAMGNRTSEQVLDSSSALSRTRTQVFNTLNQLSQQIGAAGGASVTTTFGYDNNGNQTAINAPLGRNTAQTYDELNRLKTVTDAESGLTTYGYNALDQLVSVTDPKGLTTAYTYDALGDLKQQVSPDTGVTTNTYDSDGNLTTSVDARSVTTTYGYDALNRVTSAAFGDQTISYAYDAGTNGKGRLTSASDADHSLGWTYDSHGRVTSKQQTTGAITHAASYSFSNGLLTGLTTPSGQLITYGYTNGQVTSISVNGTVVLSNVLYDPFGPVRQWTWGNGTLSARTFDQDGKITQLDSAGLKTYSYDDAFRITGITDTTNSALSWSYGYDDLDRLTSATKTGTTLGYSYDANGNRLTQTGTGASTFTVAANSNRLSNTSGALARTYAYDSAGNTTSYTGISFAYNNRGRMKSSTKSGVTTNYTYNALGQLIKKGSSALYYYDEAGHILGIYNGSGALTEEIVWLGDIPVATLRPKTGGGVNVFYIHTDHLNAPRLITQPSNNALRWRWDAHPFGGGTSNNNPAGIGVFDFNLRFPGQIYFAETGLYYNYYRDYDPSTGRYVQSDPIGLRGGINTYSYVGANPVMSFDPLGLYRGGHLECEGGKLVPKVDDLAPIDKKCGVGKCVLEHEMSHIRDFKPFERQLCRAFGPGDVVQMTPRPRAQSEARAYQVSIDCLRRLLRDEGCNQDCNNRILELIADAESQRDYWRREADRLR
jgi:RHS repeat-associated protein